MLRLSPFNVLLLLVLLAPIGALAQSPAFVSYQAVARNTKTGVELSNTDVFVITKIRRAGPNGAIVYQEEHPNVSTNLYGLFTLAIGGGNAVDGTFSAIDWSQGNFWFDIELDAGDGLESLGAHAICLCAICIARYYRHFRG